ncbi:hypothetical protein [Paenibacillus xylaniclasticus]|uniref:hypothetical protein n=1 Tax=Paenibacillus xylaniclasticus TaxID=588083 RepID=UPI000FDA4434|nr:MULTISPECIES: hypothetical protein [Paenibacillus]GFN32016.1 hypothetical protein PCURB6_22760 [Paenibacillus curdlanolyticus]
MRNQWILDVPRKVLIFMLTITLGLSGCGTVSESMPADKFLSLSLSGLAGIDHYTFEGNSGVGLPVGVTVGSVSYKGEVTDHSEMTVRMIGSGDVAGGVSGVGTMSVDGHWTLLTRRGADQWLPAQTKDRMRLRASTPSWSVGTWAGINPLDRLERMKEAAKSVSYGPSDGNSRHRIVQIVLEPSAAKQEWRHRIEAEWKAIAGGKLSQTMQAASSDKEAAYVKAERKLASMLDSLQAETRMELTADRHTMKLIKVVEHSTLRFEVNGESREEFHCGVVTFKSD